VGSWTVLHGHSNFVKEPLKAEIFKAWLLGLTKLRIRVFFRDNINGSSKGWWDKRGGASAVRKIEIAKTESTRMV
jgi:hypothetical protein